MRTQKGDIMKRGVLAKMEPFLYDYEQEWHDPCSCRLNKNRWMAICTLRDAWMKLDVSRLRRYLHRDFVYWSFSTKEKLCKNDFIKHLDKKFALRNGEPFAAQIVNLFCGQVQLDYPYAVQLSNPQYIFNPYSALHIPRFKDDKIIEIYVSEPRNYKFDVSYEKGIIKDNSGNNAEFTLTGKLNYVGDVISAKDLERHTINAAVSVLGANGANVDLINYKNKSSSANIMTVNDCHLFVYRCDTRLRQQNGFARRTCGPLKEFSDKYGYGDEKWSGRTREYARLYDGIVPPYLMPALAVITCDAICVKNKNDIPKNGSSVNLWMNEIVRVLRPETSVRSMKQWMHWVKHNDAYLKRLSEQAHVAWCADIYARSAPVLLAVKLLPVKLQTRLLTERGEKYLKALKDARAFLSGRAEELNRNGIRTPGLHREAKRLFVMADNPRFCIK